MSVKHRFVLVLAGFMAFSMVSCAKKVGCPVNDDTTPKFDGRDKKPKKPKSGLFGHMSYPQDTYRIV